MERSVSFITISCAGKKKVYSLAQARNKHDDLQRELGKRLPGLETSISKND